MPHLKSEPSDFSPNDDPPPHNMSNHLDPSRTPSFPAALLGLQGDVYNNKKIQIIFVFIIKVYNDRVDSDQIQRGNR